MPTPRPTPTPCAVRPLSNDPHTTAQAGSPQPHHQFCGLCTHSNCQGRHVTAAVHAQTQSGIPSCQGDAHAFTLKDDLVCTGTQLTRRCWCCRGRCRAKVQEKLNSARAASPPGVCLLAARALRCDSEPMRSRATGLGIIASDKLTSCIREGWCQKGPAPMLA